MNSILVHTLVATAVLAVPLAWVRPVTQDDADARALYAQLLARHAQAAALDVEATVERRIEQYAQASDQADPVAPRVIELVIDGEAHLAHPAAGWLRTSTVTVQAKDSAADASDLDAGQQDAAQQGAGDSDNLPNPRKVAPRVDLFELVGDGQAIYEINRRTRRVATLGERWFAVFPDLSPVTAWTGLSLSRPRSVVFVEDPSGAGRRGLRVTRGAAEGAGRQSTETLWLDAAGNLVAASSERDAPDHKLISKFKFRTWKLSAEVDPADYIRKPPEGFADRDVFAESEAAALLELGSPAPPVTLRGIEEGQADLSLASLRGQALLLTFWFVDCPGCEADLPRVQALWSELSKERDDLRFIGIGLTDKADAAAAYWKEIGCTYPTYQQDTDEVSRAFGVRRYPTTFVIDKDGKVLWRSAGLDEATVRAILAATR